MEEQQAIVLFYKYFSSSPPPPPSSSSDEAAAIQRWWEDPRGNVRKLYEWHEANLLLLSDSDSDSESDSFGSGRRRLPLVGRILIAPEGINGTVSGHRADVEEYVERMKNYNDLSQLPVSATPLSGTGTTQNNTGTGTSTNINTNTNTGADHHENSNLRIFRNVDYKMSYDFSPDPLFPDLKISIVKEIVSTSGLVDVHDVPLETGTHLTPEEFHELLEQSKQSKSESKSGTETETRTTTKEIALIDVRNTFEHDIGYFVDPKTNTKAIDPETTTFSSFDKFCEKNADELRNKKVLMYCTGGIRCEKASVLLKRRGVEDVNQLSGGIHRYLEKYGNTGHFKGLNFTFDKRVAMKPNFASEYNNSNYSNSNSNSNKKEQSNSNASGKDFGGEADDAGGTEASHSDSNSDSYEVVGRCVECDDPFDELCGSRVCTVCRDLVLVCNRCRRADGTNSNSNSTSPCRLREYHCKRHSDWKHCYFSFLEIFDWNELEAQRTALRVLRDDHDNDDTSLPKSVRRTLTRQIHKVESRMRGIRDGTLSVDKDAPRRCRSCQEILGEACDGKCWGFWREAEVGHHAFAAKNERDDGTTGIRVDGHSTKGSGGDGARPKNKQVLRGRRVKQKHEAEMEFLPKLSAGTPLGGH